MISSPNGSPHKSQGDLSSNTYLDQSCILLLKTRPSLSVSLTLKPTLLSKSSRPRTTFSIMSLTTHSLNPRHSGLLPSAPHLLHACLPQSLSSTWADENAFNPGTLSSVPGHHILLAPSGFFQSPSLAHLPLLDYTRYSVPLRQSPPPYTRIFLALMDLDNIYMQVRPCYGLTCVPTPNS